MIHRRGAGLQSYLAALFLVGSSILAAPVAAQLDNTCTVSALNRSARVQADGSWVLPNIPANQGQVRIRATCVAGGVVRSGQSDWITVPANAARHVDEIRFDAPAPIPAALALAAPQTTLTSPGQTVQLAATATLPDGSTANVTVGTSGTGYLSSNPAIATVGPDGLVTALVSGTVLVSALNDGALGVLRLQVVLSGDSDGDGLSDDFELANGLDPNSPVDGVDDPDGDGLSTLVEIQAGLDPFKADTDGDRLRDGEEPGYGTNPLLFDTDGDRVSDGLEVLAGSDPLNPNSVDLAPILTTLTVRPSSFTLVFNPVLGEASRRLDVTARLIDGTEIEARSRRYGTTYVSSNLAVASFGAEDGLVFAGQNGNATVTVRIGSVSGSSAVRVESFSPTALAFLLLPGSPNGVAVSGDFAYVAAGPAGLHVVDVSDLAAPIRVGTVDTPGNANDVRVEGGYAYVADGLSGLQVIDIGDPALPRIVGSRDTPGNATDLAVRGDRVFVADGLAGVQVIDVADRAHPARLGGVDTPGLARGIDAVDDLVVVADGSGGVHIVSVADPAAPAILGSTHTRITWSRAADVAVRGRLAWVADGADRTLGGLRVIDFTDPATPAVVGRTSDAFGLVGVALDRGFALTADYFFVNASPVFSADTAPLFAAAVNFYAPPAFRDDNGNGVAVRGDGAVFLAASTDIQDNGSSDPGGLHIGRYRFEGDDLGVAPEVALTLPAAGASAKERTSLTLKAEATDDVRVESVAFLVDGVEVFRDFKRPYEAKIQVPAGAASLRLGAAASDMAGSVGSAEEVVVTVIPDDKPVVTLLAPTPGSLKQGGRGEIVALATDDVQVSSVQFFVNGSLLLTSTHAPYRLDFPVQPAATEVSVQVVAFDNNGQTGSASLTVPVEDDPAPFVAIVSPVGAEEVVEGSRVTVTVGATDGEGVTRVELYVNGSFAGVDFLPPYEISIDVPAAGSALHLTAVAEDTLGQRSSSEIDLTIVPDPLTTARGRVLDGQGNAVSDAGVGCGGSFSSTDAGGVFEVSGLSFGAGVITCSAQYTDAAGKTWRLVSAPRNPVAEGITEMGDLRPSPFLLYAGFGNSGALALLNADTLEGLSLEETGIDGGISGLALDPEGRLFATSLEGEPGSRTSRLLELDPNSGAALGPPVPVVDAVGGAGLSLGDLAVHPATGVLYALRTWEDGRSQEGSLYSLDAASGVATLLGRFATEGTGGLAFAPDGALYATRWDGGRSANVVAALDPTDARVLAEAEVATREGILHGLAPRPSDGLLFATLERFSESQNKPQEIVLLDPVTGLTSEIGYSYLGKLEDLAVRPLPPPEGQTTVVGRLLDAFGAPVEGLSVTVSGLFDSFSGSDGRFAIPGVPATFGPIVARVPPSYFSSSGAASIPMPGVAGGTTDVGDLVVVADDPGTRVVGRVLDGEGNPVTGASVSCQGYTGGSGAGGFFEIPGVSVLDQVVQCLARFTTPEGELRAAVSGLRPPVGGGVTDVGDLQPASGLLYAGILVSAYGAPGALGVLGADTLQGSFLEGSGEVDYSGLASDSLSRLYASTLEGTPGSQASRLLQLDPVSGTVLTEIGPVTDGPAGAAISVGDLAVQPGTDALFALRTGEDGAGRAGELSELDRVTGVATRVGDSGTDGTGGLAFTSSGSLYTTRSDDTTGITFLRALDPASGAALTEVATTSFYGAFSGLAARPGSDTLLATPRDSIGFALVFDPTSGLGATLGFPLYGIVGDLAFQPLPPPGELTRVVGRVLDGTGAPLAGALVTVRGAFQSVSGSDGRFVVSGVPALFGDVVATVGVDRECDECTFENSASSAPVPAVAGGTTDVGDVVLADINRPTTVSGTVVDELGQPVPGAAIKIFNRSVIVHAVADAGGVFSVANVSSDESLRVLATAVVEGVTVRGTEWVQPVALGVSEVAPIVVSPKEDLPDPGTSVTGRVTDSSGLPVAGARVHVLNEWDVFPATTGADGRFTLPGVPAVDGDLSAYATLRRLGRLEEGGSGTYPPEPGATTDLGSFEIQTQQQGGGASLALPEAQPKEALAALLPNELAEGEGRGLR